MKDIKTNKLYYIHGCAVMLITILVLFHIRKLDFPTVLNDEFGYWGNAISIVGGDWTDLIAETPYYSWGYSMLLIPIIKLLPQFVWYKEAIGLNLLLLIGTYFICYMFGCRLYTQDKKELIALASMIIAIYPSNLIYAQETWTETLLYFLMWLSTYILLRLEEKFTYRNAIIFLVLLSYMYIVHARTIPILLIGSISLGFMVIKHKKKWWCLLLIPIVIGIAYGLNDIVKTSLITTYYNNSSVAQLNNLTVDSSTIMGYLQSIVSNVGIFLISLLGKLTYLVISTLGIIVVSVMYTVRNSYECIKKKSYFNMLSITELWSCLALLGMWGATSLQMMYWMGRKDVIVYSRYFEFAIGPILFIGLMYCLKKREKAYLWLGVGFGFAIVTINIVCTYVERAEGYFNSICSPFVGAFYDNIENKEMLRYVILATFVIGSVVLLFSFVIQKDFQRYVIIIGMFVVMYSIIGIKGMVYVDNYRDSLNEQLIPLKEEINWNYEGQKIYYIKWDVDTYSTQPKYLQFLIPEKKITVLEKNHLKSLRKENCMILINAQDENSQQQLEDMMNCKWITTTESLMLYSIE